MNWLPRLIRIVIAFLLRSDARFLTANDAIRNAVTLTSTIVMAKTNAVLSKGRISSLVAGLNSLSVSAEEWSAQKQVLGFP
jgi:hypothetical protein